MMHIKLLGSFCFRLNWNYSDIQGLEDLYLKMDLFTVALSNNGNICAKNDNEYKGKSI